MTSDAPRRPKPPPPGTRPGVLLDPEPAQVVDAVTSYVVAPGPPLWCARLAANDALDNATLKFLVARACWTEVSRRKSGEKREEEVKAKKEKEMKESWQQFIDQISANARREKERLDSGGASSNIFLRRKRKRRRKRRTPRTSSRTSCGRFRRRQRQWRVRHAGFAGSCAPRDVFPVACVWPLLLGNTGPEGQYFSSWFRTRYTAGCACPQLQLRSPP